MARFIVEGSVNGLVSEVASSEACGWGKARTLTVQTLINSAARAVVGIEMSVIFILSVGGGK